MTSSHCGPILSMRKFTRAVLFLASDDSSDVKAVELLVDGGATGAPFGAPIFQHLFRPLGSEAKLVNAHAEGDPH
jgi:hypothetical protein